MAMTMPLLWRGTLRTLRSCVTSESNPVRFGVFLQPSHPRLPIFRRAVLTCKVKPAGCGWCRTCSAQCRERARIPVGIATRIGINCWRRRTPEPDGSSPRGVDGWSSMRLTHHVLLFLLEEWDYAISWSPHLQTPGGEWLDGAYQSISACRL